MIHVNNDHDRTSSFLKSKQGGHLDFLNGATPEPTTRDTNLLCIVLSAGGYLDCTVCSEEYCHGGTEAKQLKQQGQGIVKQESCSCDSNRFQAHSKCDPCNKSKLNRGGSQEAHYSKSLMQSFGVPTADGNKEHCTRIDRTFRFLSIVLFCIRSLLFLSLFRS